MHLFLHNVCVSHKCILKWILFCIYLSGSTCRLLWIKLLFLQFQKKKKRMICQLSLVWTGQLMRASSSNRNSQKYPSKRSLMLSPFHGTLRGLGWPTSYLMQKKKTLNDVEIRIGRRTTTTGRTGVSEEKIETGKVTYNSTYFFYFLITFQPWKMIYFFI